MISLLLLTMIILLAGCRGTGSGASQPQSSAMELQYAENFSLEYREDGTAILTLGGKDRYLLVKRSAGAADTAEAAKAAGTADTAEAAKAAGTVDAAEAAGTADTADAVENVETVDNPDALPVITYPVERVYLASSSVADLFLQLDALDRLVCTSTDETGWRIPAMQQALSAGDITYVGKYSAPDYEQILVENCDLVVENTMIFHNPEAKEKLEQLGLPVMVEYSSYEPHPLGRVEWIKLYGFLTGKLPEAEEFFRQQVQVLEEVTGEAASGAGESMESAAVGEGTESAAAGNGTGAMPESAATGNGTGAMPESVAAGNGNGTSAAAETKTVAFFHITSNGAAVVRKSADYVTQMIRLAGGETAFTDLPAEENALSTVTIQMESFYQQARDADVLIYNSTITGDLQTTQDLLAKSELLKDFKAVQEGNVWCTEQSMFQQSSATAGMIADIHRVLTDPEAPDQLTYLHRIR